MSGLRAVADVAANAVRGFLIGTAELVPGVSGGTVALVTGVYDELVDSAANAVGALGRVARGPDRLAAARQGVRDVRLRLLVPLLLGMVVALVSIAGTMEAFVADQPEAARGLFLGLVVVSIVVPVRMARSGGGAFSWREGALVLGAAALAFVLVGLAGGTTLEDPPLLLVAAVAAVAVCALVVPGVSGSFLLLAVGLYSATLSAVDQRDLAYVGAFGLGALVGLATFVQLLQWLLEHHRRATLLTMAGLMTGSLRALWPWQGGSGAEQGTGALVAPYDPVGLPLLLAALGAAVVAVAVLVQARQDRV